MAGPRGDVMLGRTRLLARPAALAGSLIAGSLLIMLVLPTAASAHPTTRPQPTHGSTKRTPATTSPAVPTPTPPGGLLGGVIGPDGTVHVGPVSVDVPGTVKGVTKAVGGVPRTVGGTVGGVLDSVGVGAGRKPVHSGDGAGGHHARRPPRQSSTSGARRPTSASAYPQRSDHPAGLTTGHGRSRGVAAASLHRRTDGTQTSGVGPGRTFVDHAVSPTVGKDASRRHVQPSAQPGVLGRLGQLASSPLVFRPGRTLMTLMGCTVLLALLVLVMLIGVGRHTDPRLAASARRRSETSD